MTDMTPARRTKGPRPRARSTSVQQAAIWAAIGTVQQWTIPEIAAVTGCPRNTVTQYVAALARAGYVAMIEPSVATQGGGTPAVYRSHWRVKRTAMPPIVTWATRTARPQGEPTP